MTKQKIMNPIPFWKLVSSKGGLFWITFHKILPTMFKELKGCLFTWISWINATNPIRWSANVNRSLAIHLIFPSASIFKVIWICSLRKCYPAFYMAFFILVLLAGDCCGNVDKLMSVCDPIHIVLVRINPLGERTLISSQFLEWRRVLSNQGGQLKLCIELKGVGMLLDHKNWFSFLRYFTFFPWQMDILSLI